jgi:hypothetical protein
VRTRFAVVVRARTFDLILDLIFAGAFCGRGLSCIDYRHERLKLSHFCDAASRK